LERLAKKAFSARQNAFLVQHQNQLKDETGKFPEGFSQQFESTKLGPYQYFRHKSYM
jgi:hypothetical protein